MPFGLTNTLVIFQHLMNDVFRELLDKFDMSYVHDVLIYSKNIRKHEEHMKFLLQKLQDFGHMVS